MTRLCKLYKYVLRIICWSVFWQIQISQINSHSAHGPPNTNVGWSAVYLLTQFLMKVVFSYFNFDVSCKGYTQNSKPIGH